MVQTISSWLPTLVVLLIAWLLPRYIERRVTEAARGAVDVSVGKALADYRLGVDKQLEGYKTTLATGVESLRQTLALDRERYSRDYGLFATKRNEVYAETFSLLEKTRGGFASRFAKRRSYGDFSRSPAVDLRHLAERLELVSASERQSLKDAVDAEDLDRARTLASTMNERDELRRANRAFYDFRNSCTLNALYFSPAVDGLLIQVMQPLALLSTIADEVIYGEMVSPRDGHDQAMSVDSFTSQVRNAMRDEMKAGFTSNEAGEDQRA